MRFAVALYGAILAAPGSEQQLVAAVAQSVGSRTIACHGVPYKKTQVHDGCVVAWLQVAFVALFFLAAIFGLQEFPTPIYFCAVALLVRALFHIYKDEICELNIV